MSIHIPNIQLSQQGMAKHRKQHALIEQAGTGPSRRHIYAQK